MIHAKLVLIDEELALAGSANLDGRSLFLNYEMMVAFYDHKAVLTFRSGSKCDVWNPFPTLRAVRVSCVSWPKACSCGWASSSSRKRRAKAYFFSSTPDSASDTASGLASAATSGFVIQPPPMAL